MTGGAQVLLDGEGGEEVALVGHEHHAGLARLVRAAGLQRCAGDRDRSRLRRQETGHRHQKGRLAGAVGAQEGFDGPGLHREVDVAERSDAVVATAEPGALDARRARRDLDRHLAHAVTVVASCACPRYASATARFARMWAESPSAMTSPKSR